MDRINTGWIVTAMQNVMSFWNRTYKMLVSPSVNRKFLSVERECSIAGAGMSSLPQPTGIFSSGFISMKEKLLFWWLRLPRAEAYLRAKLASFLGYFTGCDSKRFLTNRTSSFLPSPIRDSHTFLRAKFTMSFFKKGLPDRKRTGACLANSFFCGCQSFPLANERTKSPPVPYFIRERRKRLAALLTYKIYESFFWGFSQSGGSIKASTTTEFPFSNSNESRSCFEQLSAFLARDCHNPIMADL